MHGILAFFSDLLKMMEAIVICNITKKKKHIQQKWHFVRISTTYLTIQVQVKLQKRLRVRERVQSPSLG